MGTIAFLHAADGRPAVQHAPSYRAQAVSSDDLFTELVDLTQLIQSKPAWADLAACAIEPNVFLEPGFAIPLFQHCQTRKKRRFLLTWARDQTDARHRLLGLLPLALPASFLPSFARGFSHPLAPLGAPLFDRDRGSDALRHMISWLRRNHPFATGLMLPYVPEGGPTFAMLDREAKAMQADLILFGRHQRAALTKAIGNNAFPDGFISAKRRKQHRQQRRRLSEIGDVSYKAIRQPAEIRWETEAFLSLESKGWKGLRGTALLAASSETTFFRAMTQLMSIEGKCRIDSLNLDGSPIGMGVILESGERAFFWKTAYDERFAALSPGVQLTLELTQTQLDSPDIKLTDSCAVANHSMIDHIWRERISIATLLLPLHNQRRIFFQIGLWRETAYRSLCEIAKSLLKRLRPAR